MDSFLSVKPGLLFWSVINFVFFLVALYFIGGKSFIKNIIKREELIKESIEIAERAQLEAKHIMEDSEEKMTNAFRTVDDLIKKGKEQAEAQAHVIIEQAEKNRNTILRQANEEIERSKQNAIREIRSEIADLVIGVTEKVLNEKLDAEKDKAFIKKFIDEMPSNKSFS